MPTGVQDFKEWQTPRTCSDNVDASVILNTLIERTGITEEQLDGTVEEGHLLKLAGLFGGWEKYVGVPGLGLNEAQKADVRVASTPGRSVSN